MLLIAAVITGAIAVFVAARLPRNVPEPAGANQPAAAAAEPPPAPRPRATRSMDQLLAELSGAYPAVVTHLKQRRIG